MAVPRGLIYRAVCLLAVFQTHVVFSKHEERRDGDSVEGPQNPFIIEYFEDEYFIKPHIIPFDFDHKGRQREESLESTDHSSDVDEHDYYNKDRECSRNDRRLEPSYSYAYVNIHNANSCSLHDQPRVKEYRLSRLGSSRESGAPDLEQLINNNRNSSGVLLVDFFATWCGPCRKMNENLNVLRSHYRADKLVIHSIDVDKEPRYNSEYNVTVLPTLIFFVNGKMHKKMFGLSDVQTLIKEIDDMLDMVN